MKENEFMEFAKNSGFEYCKDDGNFYVGGLACTSVLKIFAKLVEQVTLERAAKECEAISAFLFSPTEAIGATCCADRLRALKDSHE